LGGGINTFIPPPWVTPWEQFNQCFYDNTSLRVLLRPVHITAAELNSTTELKQNSRRYHTLPPGDSAPGDSLRVYAVLLSTRRMAHYVQTCGHPENRTLAVHNSLPLSLPAQDLPLSQIFPTTDSLPASGLTTQTYDRTVTSEHLGFSF